MPVVKFDTPTHFANNKGSCIQFVNYLSKEDLEKGNNKEFFFNHKNQLISCFDVISTIDNNKKGLGNNDAKFYTGSINLSEEELKFIKNDYSKIKEYTIEVIKEYAKNFNKGIDIDNLNWYAKIESNRYYKGNDEDVKKGITKQGNKKTGLNTHVHYIVGRKSANKKMKLSPVTNHKDTTKGPVKGGFNRDSFKENSERIFDTLFNYNRPLESTYEYNKINKKGSKSFDNNIKHDAINHKALKSSYLNLNLEQKTKRLNALIYFIQFKVSPDKKNILDKEKLINTERAYDYDSSVYKSLLNLNWRLQNNREPKDIDYTNFVLEYAEHIHNQFETIVPEMTQTKAINETVSVVTDIVESVFSNLFIIDISPSSELNTTNDDESKKKKKRKRWRDNGINM
jgi:hypothetical protein